MNKIDLRRNRILKYLSLNPIASRADLAKMFDVTPETIRKDLDALEKEKLVARVHGGVALIGTRKSNFEYDLRLNKNHDKKMIIAKAASKLIEPNDVIILESSTTTYELTKVLLTMPDLLKTLVIITNSVRIATLMENEDFPKRFYLLGGWLNMNEHATQGSAMLHALKDFHVNKSFISGAALNHNWVLTGYYDNDVAFQKQAIESAQTTILLIDSSKFYESSILTVCQLSELDYMVTDAVLDEKDRMAIEGTGIKIIQP